MPIQKRKTRPTRGRPKEVEGDLRGVNLVLESSRFKEFRELCEESGVTASEGVRQLIDQELERKNPVGRLNPINVSYDQQNKAMDLLYYLEDAIDVERLREEVPRIDSHERLNALKQHADQLNFTIKDLTNKQGMLLYNRGIKT